MQCMVCKQNEAKIHLTQIIGEKLQKVDLCEECAKTKGVNDPTGFSLADLLLGLGASQEMEKAAKTETPEGTEELRCPECGFTQADFKKAGRLGCARCYAAFAEGIEGMLRSMHKGTKHIGKVPHTLELGVNLTEQLASLQKKLEKAIATENYEDAAGLRDAIKSIKAKMNQLPEA